MASSQRIRTPSAGAASRTPCKSRTRPTVGMSLDRPFTVFVNYQPVASYDDEESAEAHFRRLARPAQTARGAT